MKIFRIAAGSFFALMLSCQVALAQTSPEYKNISLDNLSAFNEPGQNWVIASDASVDYTLRGDMKPVQGKGAIVNDFSEKNRTHLFTKEAFGDLDLELDFMMANYSNSGVYLQGRYEIQLLDSWRRQPVTSSDCGGIYLRWKKERGTFEGTPPVMNVAKAPGLWQHLHIKFRAPRFNEKGEKTANARFAEVYLNGVLVQQQAEVTGPTGSAMFPDEKDEKPTGPLVLQGDHGKVAFKNIRYRSLPPDGPVQKVENEYWIAKSPFWQNANLIEIVPSGRPYLIRTFLEFGADKLTHAISVGNPNDIHYSYDLKKGALFQVWRGKFLDVTPAWLERGGMQLGLPMGGVLGLSDAPVVAVLENAEAAWPDSVSFDDMQHHGYTLNKQRTPSFEYTLKGIDVKDSIVSQTDGEGLSRTITVSNAPQNLYCRIALGDNIESISGNLYAVNGKAYYIRVDKSLQPIIRKSAKAQEIIVPYNASNPLTYSIIW